MLRDRKEHEVIVPKKRKWVRIGKMRAIMVFAATISISILSAACSGPSYSDYQNDWRVMQDAGFDVYQDFARSRQTVEFELVRVARTGQDVDKFDEKIAAHRALYDKYIEDVSGKFSDASEYQEDVLLFVPNWKVEMGSENPIQEGLNPQYYHKIKSENEAKMLRYSTDYADIMEAQSFRLAVLLAPFSKAASLRLASSVANGCYAQARNTNPATQYAGLLCLRRLMEFLPPLRDDIDTAAFATTLASASTRARAYETRREAEYKEQQARRDLENARAEAAEKAELARGSKALAEGLVNILRYRYGNQ